MTKKHEVVIVGGGMAGLSAARELEDNNVQVTLVEASNYLGGRIRGNTTWIPNHVVDIGAEYIHGRNTLLTNLVDEYTKSKWNDKERVTYEAFITAHADGGPHPSVGTTQDGYYGRYYMDQELMDGNDARLEPLHTVLGTLDSKESCCGDDEHEVSIGDVLEKRLPPSLHDMAVASYANTVGCTNLHNVSLHMLNHFEDYWQEHEEEGDLHMDSTIGMSGIVDALVEELQTNEDFQVKLNWQVVKIQQTDNGLVKVISKTGEVLEADAVIVTVPPPLLTKLGLELSDKKIQAMHYIGFDTAVKFILKFSTRPWPSHLQSVVCAGCLVPEMWFRDYNHIRGEDDCHTATCFLTSNCAQDFLKLISRDDGKPCSEKAASVVMDQLSEMLDVPKSELVDSFVDCLLFDWSTHPFVQGGYMYPKVGLTQQHLKDLAEPDGNLFFAGEATNTNACCTIQAAMETGIRAANEVKEYLDSER